MRMYDLIRRKRDGGELTDEEIRAFIAAYTAGDVADYQVSALLMAIYFRGMTARETVTLTDAMAHSGDTVDLSAFGELSVDKHSTGGVGDKTTLIVAPIVASLGGKVAKMSGRGLGHTGGTVDKLESIDGYRTSLSPTEFMQQVEQVGVAVIGQSGNLTPADKKLYALRDVTATVDSIPLIASSIMSKKLAAGSHNIVLDVKYGSGAFMKSVEDAERLARQMVDIGKGCGRRVAAVLSNMDVPLGCAVGNALELQEAVAILRGESGGALREVCVTLASEMVQLVHGWSSDEAIERVEEAITSGAAYDTMRRWIAAQGGDVRCLEEATYLPHAAYTAEVRAPRDGYICRMDAERIGYTALLLGAGRMTKEDAIDYAAGLYLHRSSGDYVRQGDTLCTLYTNDESRLTEAAKTYLDAVVIGDESPLMLPTIHGIVR